MCEAAQDIQESSLRRLSGTVINQMIKLLCNQITIILADVEMGQAIFQPVIMDQLPDALRHCIHVIDRDQKSVFAIFDDFPMSGGHSPAFPLSARTNE